MEVVWCHFWGKSREHAFNGVFVFNNCCLQRYTSLTSMLCMTSICKESKRVCATLHHTTCSSSHIKVWLNNLKTPDCSYWPTIQPQHQKNVAGLSNWSFQVSAVIECNRRDINKICVGLGVRGCSMNREILHCHITAWWGRKDKWLRSLNAGLCFVSLCRLQ